MLQDDRLNPLLGDELVKPESRDAEDVSGFERFDGYVEAVKELLKAAREFETRADDARVLLSEIGNLADASAKRLRGLKKT
ncbi:MAG TPA: hypothetical protein DEP35_16095, partial [Deltaproteobacteria bacterium]|nr:hypothetical protein [Deltaproteobacteria bacterium]